MQKKEISNKQTLKETNTISQEKLNVKIIDRLLVGFLLFTGILFGAAGTFNWPEAWLYIIVQFSYSIALSVWLKRNNPELLKDRMIFMKKTAKTWDKAIMIGTLPLSITLIIIPGLDAVRYQWSQVIFPLKAISFIVILASFALFFWVIKENTYLSRVVEIQKERGHKVITTGPYKYVRHPMYVGVIALLFSLPVALGSLYGLIPAAFLLIVIIIRTHLEDRTLHNELTEYEEYAEETKYRLLPGVW